MTTTNSTPNRGYQEPYPSNKLAEDVGRLIAALRGIDADVASALSALASKAAATHTHVINDVSGLQSALDAKMAANAAIALASLSDVDVTGAAASMFLRLVSGKWSPVAFDASMIASGVIGSDRLPPWLTQAAIQSMVNGVAAPTENLVNRIINGNMAISQYNGYSAVTPVVSSFIIDRWKAFISQPSKLTFVQDVNNGPVDVGGTCLRVTVAQAATLGANDYFTITQGIETANFADFAFGTASAKTLVLSFFVRSSMTGTFGGSLSDPDNSRSYPFVYTISQAGVWTKISIMIPGDTGSFRRYGGPWRLAAKLSFSLGAGSTYSGAASTWASGDFMSATVANNVVGTLGATWEISGVQLEAGSLATAFQRRQIGHELALCQRYYETGTDTGASMSVTSGNYYYNYVRFSVPKRASPTITPTDVYNVGFPAGVPTIYAAHNDQFKLGKQANSSNAAGVFLFNWTASAELV